MPLSKKEINKIKLIFSSKKKALSKRAIRQLVPLDSAYLYATAFSNFEASRLRYRNRLNAASDSRIQFPNIEPNVQRICE
jgi:hypothetical protein